MATIKFKVEPEAFDQTGFAEQPKPDVYEAQVKEINSGYSKNDDGTEDKKRPRLEVIYEITDEKAKTKGNDGGSALGARVWDYVTFGSSSQWKLAQFTKAFGLADKSKPSGEFNTAKLAEKVTDISANGKKIVKETGHPGAKCKIRVGPGSDQDGGYRAKVRSILPIGGDSDSSDGEEVVVDDDSAIESDETGDAMLHTESDLKLMGVPALKEIATSMEIDFKGMKKSEVIAAILEAQTVADDEMVDDDEEIIDDEGEAGYSEDELKALDVPTLKEVAKQYDIGFGGKKKSEVIAAILAAQEEAGGGGGDEEIIADDGDDGDLPF